jgi:hypothetical protein
VVLEGGGTGDEGSVVRKRGNEAAWVDGTAGELHRSRVDLSIGSGKLEETYKMEEKDS